jgi:peptidoglycan-associated lipoprotein
MRLIKSTQFSIFALLATILIVGCGKKYSMEEANKAYENKQYALAAEMYDGIYKDKSTARGEKSEIAFKAGEAYRNFENYEKAERSYEKALSRDPNNAQALYMQGVVQQNMGEYKDAIKTFNKYLKLFPGDKDAMAKIKGCELALGWKDDCTRYEVENFKVANSRQNDYCPMIADKKDGVIYFTSDRNPNPKKREKLYVWTGNGFSDLWMVKEQKQRRRRRGSSNTEKKWDRPEHLEAPPNTKANDGTPAFNRRFNVMYFTICNGGDNKSAACKIYESRKVGAGWGTPQVLSFCEKDSNYSYGQPTLSPDGKKLYFSSNREGGYGGHDIWVVNYVRRGRTWSEPVNLGPVVNTAKNEMFPYWNQHENKLYFASSGHPGFGGLDMFSTEGSGEEWSTPENLSIPMNSGADDFGITFDNNNPLHGFFSSNRDGGRGGDDIYEFTKIPPIIDVKGVVTDCTTEKPLPGSLVTITNTIDSTKIEIIADEQGSYFAELQEGVKYTIQVTNDTNYYFASKRIAKIDNTKVKCDTHYVENFCLKSMIEVWELPIFYDLDKAFIRPDAQQVLNTFAKEVLLEYPRIVIELGSHTDCRSSYAYNMDLSRRRADSAVAYLVGLGIDKNRVFAKGYGESQLTNKCKCEGAEIVPCTEAEHQENRRTTVKIVNFNFDPRKKKVIGGNPLNTNDGIGNDSAYIMDSASLAREKAMRDSAMAAKAKADAEAKRIDSLSVKLKITETNGVKTVPIKLNEKEEVAFAYDIKSRKNTIPISMAEKWMESGLINKGNFRDGDKMKGPNGVKFPSKSFTMDIVDVGGYIIKRVTFYIVEDGTQPTIGKYILGKFNPAYIKEDGGYLKMLPKRPQRR